MGGTDGEPPTPLHLHNDHLVTTTNFKTKIAKFGYILSLTLCDSRLDSKDNYKSMQPFFRVISSLGFRPICPKYMVIRLPLAPHFSRKKNKGNLSTVK